MIHTYRFGSPGAFNLVAQAGSDGDLAAVERALLSAIGDLREGRIDSGALERGRKRLRVEWAEFLDNPPKLAFLIGHHYSMTRQGADPIIVLVARDRDSGGCAAGVSTYFVPSNR